MTSYRDSDAYRRSQKVDPRNGKPVYPLKFDLSAKPLVSRALASMGSSG